MALGLLIDRRGSSFGLILLCYDVTILDFGLFDWAWAGRVFSPTWTIYLLVKKKKTSSYTVEAKERERKLYILYRSAQIPIVV